MLIHSIVKSNSLLISKTCLAKGKFIAVISWQSQRARLQILQNISLPTTFQSNFAFECFIKRLCFYSFTIKLGLCKNGSGCFMLGIYTANDDFVIKGCEYGDFVARNHIVINRNSHPPFAPKVVKWALEREISLLESECKNAELRLKNERNKKCIIIRKLVLQDYQEQLQKAQRVKILP